MSINVSQYDGVINNLTIQGNCTVAKRMFIQYNGGGAQVATGGTSPLVEFPTAISQVNVTGVTVSGTNNTRFTNSSSTLKTWIISSSLAAANNDTVNTRRINIRILKNGVNILANNLWAPPSAPGFGIAVSGAFQLNPTDYIEIQFASSQTVDTTINSAFIFITEV